MYCPSCEIDEEGELTPMTQMFSFDSETGKLDAIMECTNPQCPVAFSGVMYKTTKDVLLEKVEAEAAEPSHQLN